MGYSDCELLSKGQVTIIKFRCRKLGLRADQVDDYLQDFAIKSLLSNCNNTTLNYKAIDNHIISQLRKETRYQKLLDELTDDFQEAVVYHLDLQIDIRSLIPSLSSIQQKICNHISAGMTHKEISKKLKISLRTIGREMAAIRRLIDKYDL